MRIIKFDFLNNLWYRGATDFVFIKPIFKRFLFVLPSLGIWAE